MHVHILPYTLFSLLLHLDIYLYIYPTPIYGANKIPKLTDIIITPIFYTLNAFNYEV